MPECLMKANQHVNWWTGHTKTMPNDTQQTSTAAAAAGSKTWSQSLQMSELKMWKTDQEETFFLLQFLNEMCVDFCGVCIDRI